MKVLGRILAALGCIIVVLVAAVWLMLGGGHALPDRSTTPTMRFDVVEKVADLDYPPGNIAVSADGRVFFTLHPDGHPPRQVVELVHGKPVAFPNEEFQHESPGIPWFQSILSMRIDRQGRLWTLDFARFGRGTPRIVAFDIATRKVVHEYDFPSDVAGLGSMLNDFQVDPSGRYIYIAETSPVLQRPALIVYDTESRTSRRLLDGHESVQAEPLIIQAGARRMLLPGGILPLRIAVDSIALSRDGAWLYYGAVTGSRMYRIRASDLLDSTLDAGTLASRVEVFADKTLSDGLTTDDAGNVYLGDMEHSAIHRLHPDGRLETLLIDAHLRWPDGFSFGPDGYLYVTCSALQQVLFRPDTEIRAGAPYQIWRFRPGPAAASGQ
ncbi:MAG TPA: L-dopachrome tautomerase-related protein [Candidatus Limnocylindrales bacterium]|nr:L-dopachrome tautomerase-related protein [Candidatus Limnocylindrales bacterium]